MSRYTASSHCDLIHQTFRACLVLAVPPFENQPEVGIRQWYIMKHPKEVIVEQEGNQEVLWVEMVTLLPRMS
jgi:hypothetical protein